MNFNFVSIGPLSLCQLPFEKVKKNYVHVCLEIKIKKKNWEGHLTLPIDMHSIMNEYD